MLLISFGTSVILNAVEFTKTENDDGLTDWYKPVAIILSPISKEELFQTVTKKSMNSQQPIATTFTYLPPLASCKYY